MRSGHFLIAIKFLIILTVALAAVAANLDPIPIVRSTFESNDNGAYQVAYETGNGIVAQANGIVKDAGSDHPAAEVTGSYHYTAPDGSPVDVSYIANENGFQPQGNVLPVAPAIPDVIARSLKYIAAQPPYDETKL